MRHLLFTLLAAPLLTVSSTPASAQNTIVCESRHHDYNYCRANTHNQVRLERRLSRASCVEGRTWGYDRNGIWVDEGCEARFAYGRNTSRHNDSRRRSGRDRDDDNNVGAAVAVGAIALALGAAAVASANDDHHKHSSNYASQRDSDRPPSWMIGSFEGYNDSRKEIIVHSDGTIDQYYRGDHVRGVYDDGRIYLGEDSRFDVERESQGFRVINTRNRDENRYRRVR